MLPRTTTPLVVTYLLLIGAGVIFMTTPPTSILYVTVFSSLTTVWGLFFVVGGLVSLVSTSLRMHLKTKSLISLWQFETAGLSLIVAANLIYSYALLRTGLSTDQYSYVAVSLIVSAFASSFIARVLDVFALVKAVNTVAAPLKGVRDE